MKFSFDKLDNLLKTSKIPPTKILRDLGLSSGMIGQWRAKRCQPKIEALEKITNYINKSMLGCYELSMLDAEFIASNLQEIFNLLTPNEIESNARVLDEESLAAPYVGNAAANPMGKENPIDLEYDLGEYGQHDMQVMKRFFDPNGIWVMVEGDSMEPTLHNGEYVYVSPNRQIEPGKIGFFRINDKTLIKRLYRVEGSNNIILKSDNPKYKPIIITKHVDFQQSGLIVQAARILE